MEVMIVLVTDLKMEISFRCDFFRQFFDVYSNISTTHDNALENWRKI